MSYSVFSAALEQALVQRNMRGMANLRPHLRSGYLARAARILYQARGVVLIGTGFPVLDTFETDGPAGAIALYKALEQLGATPVLVCGDPLYSVLKKDFRCEVLPVNQLEQAKQYSRELLDRYQPVAVLSIERPGLAENGRYHNMRGEDISERCACFDYLVTDAKCPTIGIGDGGNEIGMGQVKQALAEFSIIPSATEVDELVIADVSNWGAYGLIACFSLWSGKDFLAHIQPKQLLSYLSERGSVDGVTRLNTLTEDSLESEAAEQLIQQFQSIVLSHSV